MIRKLFNFAYAAALIIAALPASAATVVLSGTSGSSCTYSAVAFAADGTMTVTCSGGGGGPAGQTISFGVAPSITVGGTGTVSATATSGLAVTLTSQTTSVCTISGTTVTGVSAGSCTIAANQAGNASYSAAPQVTQTFTIGSGGGAGYTCNDTTSYDAILGVFPSGNGGTHLIPAAGGTAVGSFEFTIRPNEPTGKLYEVSYRDQVSGSFNAKDSAISRCKGDFTGKGIPAGTACFAHGARPSEGLSFRIGGTAGGCVIDKTGVYYLNIRGQTVGDSPGVVLGFNEP